MLIFVFVFWLNGGLDHIFCHFLFCFALFRTFIGEGVFNEGDEGVVKVRFVIIFW